jgi:hypothetical protein
MNRHITVLTDADPVAEQLPLEVCRVPLKRHQLALINQCRVLEACGEPIPNTDERADVCTRMGVICDKPGAGKSFVALALTAGPPPTPLTTTVITYATNTVTITSHNTRRRHELDIIVVPHTIVLQWQRYLAHFPTLRAVVLRRNKSITEFVRDDALLGATDVVLVVNTMYNHLALLLTNRKKHVRRVVFDEADSIDIPGSIQLSCDFTWFMTASHGVLMNPRGFTMWNSSLGVAEHTTSLRASGWINHVFSSLQSAPAQYVGKLFLKNDDAFVDASFLLPDLHVHKVLCEHGKNLRVFGGLNDTRLLAYLNAHDLTGALSLLNPTLRESEENIIAAFVREHVKRQHNLRITLDGCARMYFQDDQQREQREASLRGEIEKLESIITGIRDRVREEGDCPVCMSDFQGKVLMRCCQRPICLKCSHQWLKQNHEKRCPFCKHPIGVDGFMVVDETSEQRPPVEPTKDKFATAIEMIEGSAPERKFLVFSHHQAPLFHLWNELTLREITCSYVKGRPTTVGRVLDSFSSGGTKVLFANSAYYGSGLNIEATTDIIIFHKMNADIENQIIGRAQRPGRTQPLNVWYLLYENESG